jgi:putative DNA methylase
MTQHIKPRKKLIEVALPLEAINKASVRENFIYRGNPSAIHKWWAQRPLAAARAVIFAQMVDDPSEYVDTLLGEPTTRRAAQRELRKRQELWDKRKVAFEVATGREVVAVPEPGAKPTLDECAADIERERLFRIIEELVKWENTTDEKVLDLARAEIWRSWRAECAENVGHPRAKELFDRYELPRFHDPFAGGGTLPLEAQRLGMECFASDLNPVAVLITKALIEIAPRFAGTPPVNPKVSRDDKTLVAKQWRGTEGLADDVRYYGQWMRNEAEKRIGHLYPQVEISAEMAKTREDLKPLVGRKLTIISWLWARTVKSPNPAFANVDVPLASTFMLSTKPGKEVFVEPIIEDAGYRFNVKVGKPVDAEAAKRGTKSASSGSSFLCLMSGTPMPFDYLRREAKAGRMGTRLMATVVEGERRRIYLPPTAQMEALAYSAEPMSLPDTELPKRALGFRVQEYGMTKWRDLFTSRQLVALTTLSDLVIEARERVKLDAMAAGTHEHNADLSNEVDANAYADAIATLLAFCVDKTAEYGCTIVPWYAKEDRPKGLFARQAIPMVWDYAEVNPLANIGGSFEPSVNIVAGSLNGCPIGKVAGKARQLDAISAQLPPGFVVSTDPPYYDNIGYADLSDFFYVWLRRSLRSIFPELFSTLAVPKAEELVATPFRHKDKEAAEAFFMDGMTRVMRRLAEQSHPAFPVTIYYAFKQSETDDIEGTSSTGWETFLDAVIGAGFALSGTWPMRTERGSRSVAKGTNALASSIVLVCRHRASDAPIATRRDFVTSLKAELPHALAHLQRGNIAPVDLAQAAIGPGMAVYTRYAKVLDAEGKALSVRDALSLINQTLDEALAEQEGDFDPDSRWALAWFEQQGFAEGEFGIAETLSKAKNTSVAGMVEAGILSSSRGKVRLLKPVELSEHWDPSTDPRLTVWEMVHQMIRVLETSGEATVAELVVKLGPKPEIARELAYRLYTLCERKKRAAEALSYNALVQSWPEIIRLARDTAVAVKTDEPVEPDMFGRA